jgi:hypothetical protein
MIKTKHIITNINEVPDTWVYEYFTGVPKLTGQTESILSIFNTTDTSPSLVFYRKGGEYLFKDFSEGSGGDKIQFYKKVYKLKHGVDIPSNQILVTLMNLYQTYLSKNDYRKADIVDEPKFKIQGFEARAWYDYDTKYWKQFNITSKILDYFNVKALKSISLSNGIRSFTIKRGMTYGYFMKDDVIYKTYSPLEEKAKKFNKFVHYIQGWEQLRCDGRTAVICSSLKDMMSLWSLGYDVDVLAPASENSYLSLSEIDYLKTCYNTIYVLFDNDTCGINSAAEYEERFEIHHMLLPLSKDLSDSIRDFGVEEVKQFLNPYLK